MTFTELATRENDGATVTLEWTHEGGLDLMFVRVSGYGQTFLFSPPPDVALEAFLHPYAYAPADAPDIFGRSQSTHTDTATTDTGSEVEFA